MKRRDLIRRFSSILVILFSGCSSESGGNITASPTSSPTPTPSPPPTITTIDVKEIPDPRGLNPLGFQINYNNLKSNKNYTIELTVKSEMGIKKRNWRIQSKFGLYAGMTGTKIKPTKGTSTDDSVISYTVSLLGSGDTIDSREGEVEYE